jgi:hypothetical protein
MSTPTEWQRAFARQADADLKAWELYEKYPQAVATACHKRLFLQMACEGLCKAHLIERGASYEKLQSSHAYVANQLSIIVMQQISFMKSNLREMGMKEVMKYVRYLANEIEPLNPAVTRNDQRPDNCEYPWEDARRALHSPFNWTFHPSHLLTVPGGRRFLILLRMAIDRIWV